MTTLAFLLMSETDLRTLNSSRQFAIAAWRVLLDDRHTATVMHEHDGGRYWIELS